MVRCLEEVDEDDGGHPAGKDGLEDSLHHIDDRVHLTVGAGLAQSDEEDERHPGVDIGVSVVVGGVVPGVEGVAESKGGMFGYNYAGIVEGQQECSGQW